MIAHTQSAASKKRYLKRSEELTAELHGFLEHFGAGGQPALCNLLSELNDEDRVIKVSIHKLMENAYNVRFVYGAGGGVSKTLRRIDLDTPVDTFTFHRFIAVIFGLDNVAFEDSIARHNGVITVDGCTIETPSTL